jgi:hypothetical protein
VLGPASAPASMPKAGMNSSSSGGEDGRYGSVGGGTTVNPSEKSNWWYGLKTGAGRMLGSLWLRTARGGISSNYGRLVSGGGGRGRGLTLRLKSPNSPQLLGVADGTAEVEVAVELFKYKGVERKVARAEVEGAGVPIGASVTRGGDTIV